MKHINDLYNEACEELRRISSDIARMTAHMDQARHKHPFDRPLPSATDWLEKLTRAQRNLTRYSTMLELGIESVQGTFREATFTRLPAPPLHPEVQTSSREVGPNMPQWLETKPT